MKAAIHKWNFRVVYNLSHAGIVDMGKAVLNALAILEGGFQLSCACQCLL